MIRVAIRETFLVVLGGLISLATIAGMIAMGRAVGFPKVEVLVLCAAVPFYALSSAYSLRNVSEAVLCLFGVPPVASAVSLLRWESEREQYELWKKNAGWTGRAVWSVLFYTNPLAHISLVLWSWITYPRAKRMLAEDRVRIQQLCDAMEPERRFARSIDRVVTRTGAALMHRLAA